MGRLLEAGTARLELVENTHRLYAVKRLQKLEQLDWSPSTEVAIEQVAAGEWRGAKRRKVVQHEQCSK